MAGNALGTTFSLLLLATITQGLKDVEDSHIIKMEAVVGQNVTLPCTLKRMTDVKIISIEWRKENEDNTKTKLAVYSQGLGQHLFTRSVSIKIENTNADNSFHLYFPAVNKFDSGIYVCDIATFPLGFLRRVTELKVKDVDKILCDVDSTVEVHNGKNVTIRCSVLPNAHYKWTKDKKLVSEKESLELWQVTDVHEGVYTLTVKTGNKNLYKEFNIIVLTVTTSLRTDLVTVSPLSNVTREDLVNSADSSFTTPATDTSVTWTVSTSTDVTDDSPNNSNVTVTTGDYITSFTNDTHIRVTSSPATHTDPYHLLNSTTLSYDSTVFSPTQEMSSDEMRNESTSHIMNPDDVFPPEVLSTLRYLTGTYHNSVKKKETKNGMEVEANARSHLLVLITIPLLVLIVVAGFLYRRHIIKQRMDLPPPFKPPPPPVKYAAARQNCYAELIGLVLLSLALLISMCLNFIFCIRRRATFCKDRDDCCYSHNVEGEGLSQDEGPHFHDLNHQNQENPHNHHERQENPIYGNITIDRRVTQEVCYEMMTKQQTRDPMKPLERDLNYASLDLKVAKKRKKHRYQQGQAQGRNNCIDQLPAHSTPSVHDFLEVDGDIDAHLPPRDTSTMVSHSSIYLNSQQIAQEAEEMERERSINMEWESIGWEGIRRQENGGSREWKEGQKSEERNTQNDNGTACAQLSEDIQSGTDHFNSSFNHDGDQ